MSSGLALTSSSAALYVQTRTTRAQIVARINEGGTSEALIEADQVSVEGTTRINDVMAVSNDVLLVKKNAGFQGNISMQASGSNIRFASGTGLYFIAGPNAGHVIDSSVAANIFVGATVSGNTLTLTNISGGTVTFNKAAPAPILDGSWRRGTITVKSTPEAQEDFKHTIIQKPGTWASDYKSITIPIYAQFGSSGQYEEDTGRTVTVNTTDSYDKGEANGRKLATVTMTHNTVTEDSPYQKYVTYTAVNNSNTQNKATRTLYLVKSGNKAQLRENSASGTLVMEINTT